MSYCDFEDEPSLLDDVLAAIRWLLFWAFLITAVLGVWFLLGVFVLGVTGNLPK